MHVLTSHIHLFIYLFIYLFIVSFFIYLFIYLLIHLFIYLILCSVLYYINCFIFIFMYIIISFFYKKLYLKQNVLLEKKTLWPPSIIFETLNRGQNILGLVDIYKFFLRHTTETERDYWVTKSIHMSRLTSYGMA